MKASNILILTLCTFLPLTARAGMPQVPVNGDYSYHTFTDADDASMPYRMLAPANVDEGVRYPLVVFLHGAGERGDDNEKQLTHGASVFSNPANADRYPAFVIFPQCKEKSWTADKADPRGFMSGAPVPAESETEKTLMRLIGDVVAANPIDPSRIYIVGISMGGIAAYDIVCRHPNVFAAAVPICGAVNPERLADAKDVKFMIFHGEDDEEVPSICSREAYKALSAAGAQVDYVEFAGIGHECWSSAFNYPTLLPWLFAQTKSQAKADGPALSYIDDKDE